MLSTIACPSLSSLFARSSGKSLVEVVREDSGFVERSCVFELLSFDFIAALVFCKTPDSVNATTKLRPQ